jgi:glutaredoxin
LRLTIYSKPGCHLCDDMKATVHRVALDSTVAVDEVDISNDPELLDRYGLEIPVLMMDGKKIAKYRVTDSELRRMIQRRE